MKTLNSVFGTAAVVPSTHKEASVYEDLAAELGTVIRYTYQAAKCCGLLAAELRELLVKEAQDELDHAAYLMDVIQDLGGEPTTTPKPF